MYDSRGLMVQAKALGTGGTVTGTQTNTYDYSGRRVMVTSPTGSKTRYFNRYTDSTSADGNINKYYFLGDRLVASWVKSYPVLTDAPPSAYRPESWKAPAVLLFPLAGGLLLMLLVPGARRVWSVSLPRSVSMCVVLVASAGPVILVAGCGNPPIVRHYHLDRLGTTQVVTDYNGNIYRQVRYDAYGEVRARFNGAGNPVSGVASDARYEFTGYETDAFSGLDYAGARFYDPELGQFQSHDPKRQFASPYAYGPGDPINGTDPTGEDFGISLLVVALIAAAAAFVDSYLETGSFGLALASAGMAFVGTFVGAGVGWVIDAGLKGANALVTVAVRAAQVGYAGYGVVDGFSNGRPFSAGVSVGLLAYGLGQGNGEGGEEASGSVPAKPEIAVAAAEGKGEPAQFPPSKVLEQLEVPGRSPLGPPVQRQMTVTDFEPKLDTLDILVTNRGGDVVNKELVNLRIELGTIEGGTFWPAQGTPPSLNAVSGRLPVNGTSWRTPNGFSFDATKLGVRVTNNGFNAATVTVTRRIPSGPGV